MSWDPKAPKVGEQAADLNLLDEEGSPVSISSLVRGGPLLALVFRDPDDESSLRLLRDYRDSTLALRMAGVAVCAIGRAEPGALAFMRRERGLGFPLLADADGSELPRWGMLGETGVLLLDRQRKVKQRALGARASPASMITFLRRGGVRTAGFRERLGRALLSLSHALKPRRLAR